MRKLSIPVALLAALTLCGCLLPQPDTPIIPPVQPATGRGALPPGAPGAASDTRTQPVQAAQPVAMPVPEQQAGMLAPPTSADAGATKASSEEPGQLAGLITGRTAVRVTAVPVHGGEKVTVDVDRESRFTLSLAPGAYHLDLELAGETQPVRVEAPLTVESGKLRQLTLTLSATRATLTEDVPLTPIASASPSPTP